MLRCICSFNHAISEIRGSESDNGWPDFGSKESHGKTATMNGRRRRFPSTPKKRDDAVKNFACHFPGGLRKKNAARCFSDIVASSSIGKREQNHSTKIPMPQIRQVKHDSAYLAFAVTLVTVSRQLKLEACLTLLERTHAIKH